MRKHSAKSCSKEQPLLTDPADLNHSTNTHTLSSQGAVEGFSDCDPSSVPGLPSDSSSGSNLMGRRPALKLLYGQLFASVQRLHITLQVASFSSSLRIQQPIGQQVHRQWPRGVSGTLDSTRTAAPSNFPRADSHSSAVCVRRRCCGVTARSPSDPC